MGAHLQVLLWYGDRLAEQHGDGEVEVEQVDVTKLVLCRDGGCGATRGSHTRAVTRERGRGVVWGWCGCGL